MNLKVLYRIYQKFTKIPKSSLWFLVLEVYRPECSIVPVTYFTYPFPGISGLINPVNFWSSEILNFKSVSNGWPELPEQPPGQHNDVFGLFSWFLTSIGRIFKFFWLYWSIFNFGGQSTPKFREAGVYRERAKHGDFFAGQKPPFVLFHDAIFMSV